MLGIDYGCHQWHQALNAGTAFRIRTFIDDEPWNHRTRIGEAPVQYPGELAALVRKHGAAAVVRVEGAKIPPVDDWTFKEMITMQVPILTLPARPPRIHPIIWPTLSNAPRRLGAAAQPRIPTSMPNRTRQSPEGADPGYTFGLSS